MNRYSEEQVFESMCEGNFYDHVVCQHRLREMDSNEADDYFMYYIMRYMFSDNMQEKLYHIVEESDYCYEVRKRHNDFCLYNRGIDPEEYYEEYGEDSDESPDEDDDDWYYGKRLHTTPERYGALDIKRIIDENDYFEKPIKSDLYYDKEVQLRLNNDEIIKLYHIEEEEPIEFCRDECKPKNDIELEKYVSRLIL